MKESKVIRLRSGNYYGGFMCMEKDGKYYHGVGDYNGTEWCLCTKDFYEACIRQSKYEIDNNIEGIYIEGEEFDSYN